MVLIKNLKFFYLYICGKTAKENAFYDIVEKKIVFWDYKNKEFKKTKYWDFSKRNSLC